MRFNKMHMAAMVGLLWAHAAIAGPTNSHASVRAAEALLKSQGASVNAAAEDGFTASDAIVDGNGDQHVRFDRSHRGLPVIGGDFVLHMDSHGAFKGASLTQRVKLNVDTVARVSEDSAIQYARGLFSGTVQNAPTARLVVYARTDQARLAYEVLVTGELADGSPSEMHYFVDANTSQILDKWEGIETAATTGIGNSLTEGVVSLTTDSQTSGYAMRDPSRGNHYVNAMSNRTNGNGSLLTDADNTWGDSTTANTQTVAVDALYGQNRTWDFYKNVLGRNGIDGAGKAGYSRVHYGRKYVNAFWSDSCFCMTYGDGDGTTYLPLVALDVAGHEMTHGVTASTAKLVYSGESGGLNEAMSDIMGTAIEYYANNANSKPNYLIGERIFKASYTNPDATKALRYMFKPSLDASSPDCYVSTIGSLNVHYSSGVANHFFYLMNEGAVVPSNFTATVTPSSLVCNGNTALTGIGRDKGAKIMYRALSVYMTSNTNYAGARVASLNAASDLYGAASAEYNTVASAWSAVGVN